MPAPRSSGRGMSAWLKAVKPALKLMNVLTTAIGAGEIAVAAGMPSSRTRPDDCRVNKPCPAAGLPEIGVLAMFSSLLGPQAHTSRLRTVNNRAEERTRPVAPRLGPLEGSTWKVPAQYRMPYTASRILHLGNLD